MKNRLAEHLSPWKAWYAIPASCALLISSLIPMLGTLVGGDRSTLVTAVLVAVQFMAIAAVAVGILAVCSRRWPTAADLGLKRRLPLQHIVLLVVVFVVSHLGFWLLTVGGPADPQAAQRYFTQQGLDGALLPAAIVLFSSVVLAPVCEELLYRAAILRPIHDALALRGAPTLGAVLGILAGSVAFALPHLGGSLTGSQAAAYMLTGIAFGLVYVLTGSLTAAMVSHSLQSCFAFAQILIFGSGDHHVSPVLYILVFTCPAVVYLIARALRGVFPTSDRQAPGQPTTSRAR